MSSGFSGRSTRGMSDKIERQVETRMRLDVFTDDFNPPGTEQKVPGADFDKPDNGYQDKHTDTVPEADPSFPRLKKLQPAGKAEDQEYLDEVDRAAHSFQSRIKPVDEQFPGGPKQMEAGDVVKGYEKKEAKHEKKFTQEHILNRLSEGVDEGLWSKAKDASQEAFGKIKWPFVMYWYEKHGGK